MIRNRRSLPSPPSSCASTPPAGLPWCRSGPGRAWWTPSTIAATSGRTSRRSRRARRSVLDRFVEEGAAMLTSSRPSSATMVATASGCSMTARPMLGPGRVGVGGLRIGPTDPACPPSGAAREALSSGAIPRRAWLAPPRKYPIDRRHRRLLRVGGHDMTSCPSLRPSVQESRAPIRTRGRRPRPERSTSPRRCAVPPVARTSSRISTPPPRHRIGVDLESIRAVLEDVPSDSIAAATFLACARGLSRLRIGTPPAPPR